MFKYFYFFGKDIEKDELNFVLDINLFYICMFNLNIFFIYKNYLIIIKK